MAPIKISLHPHMSTVLHPVSQGSEPARNESIRKGSGGTVFKFGVIGFGYWGPNVVRNLDQLEGCTVAAVCDRSPTARQRVHQGYPQVKVLSQTAELISSAEIDAIAIATPVESHYELTKAALQNGKHVFVEKPFTSDSNQAEELINLAAAKNLQIMVDHTFLFTGAVRAIRQLLEEDALGQIYYYDSTRVNLGLFQDDVNVIWDLASHDLSIIDHLIKEAPEAVSAAGQAHLNGFEDVAFITVYYPSKIIAHINVNWLSPMKVRTTVIGGDKKMLVWNDLEAVEKVKVYDRGVDITSGGSLCDLPVNYRSGNIWAPQVERTEALKQALAYFIDCVSSDRTPFNDGAAGLRVVKLLEAANRSVQKRGALVYL
jgi:predicted dehydrogenase